MRFVLASSSPARLQTLRRAGLAPEVISPDVDESAVSAPSAADLVMALARLKGGAVLPRLASGGDAVCVACDSLLELDGRGWGKPGDDEEARRRWRMMRGREGILLTGHHVAVLRTHASGGRDLRERTAVAATTVRFADVSNAEIDAYVATGEPQQVAGAFTIDGFGAAFVESLSGDPHNVVGISVPLLRVQLAALGVDWTSLWCSHPVP